MHLDQWKTAGEQLLRHWNRSGLGFIPASNAQDVAAAKDWLELQEAQFFTSTEPSAAPSDATAGLQERTESSHLASASQSAQASAMGGPSVERLEPTAVSAVASNGLASGSDSVASRGPASSAELPVLGTFQPWGAALDLPSRTAQLAQLDQQVKACRKCEEIACRRQRTVFGAGPSNARIVMFGEAPEAEEDRKGESFIGPAGELLDKILIASGLKREEVYILNALKCRPPNSRTPMEAEIENCRPFFESQLEIIQPDYIVCWGAIAARAVLKSTESVGRLRGRFHAYRGAKVLVTYPPSYLLRNVDAKRLTWEDMKMLMLELGIPVAKKPGTK
jgi:uracil-DNA glycosylase